MSLFDALAGLLNRDDSEDAPPQDIRAAAYLGTPKPGALAPEAVARFTDPRAMPSGGGLADLKVAPDYSRVGVPQDGGRSLASRLSGLFSGTPRNVPSTGNPVADFLNSIVPPSTPKAPVTNTPAPAPVYRSPDVTLGKPASPPPPPPQTAVTPPPPPPTIAPAPPAYVYVDPRAYQGGKAPVVSLPQAGARNVML